MTIVDVPTRDYSQDFYVQLGRRLGSLITLKSFVERAISYMEIDGQYPAILPEVFILNIRDALKKSDIIEEEFKKIGGY